MYKPVPNFMRLLGFSAKEDDKIPTVGNFIALAGNENCEYFAKLYEKYSKIPVYKHFDDKKIFNMSDDLNYRRFGYNSLMITDTALFRNPNYHQSTDTIETIDLEKIESIANSVYNTICNL
jgi:hypothetical protein